MINGLGRHFLFFRRDLPRRPLPVPFFAFGDCDRFGEGVFFFGDLLLGAFFAGDALFFLGLFLLPCLGELTAAALSGG